MYHFSPNKGTKNLLRKICPYLYHDIITAQQKQYQIYKVQILLKHKHLNTKKNENFLVDFGNFKGQIIKLC